MVGRGDRRDDVDGRDGVVARSGPTNGQGLPDGEPVGEEAARRPRDGAECAVDRHGPSEEGAGRLGAAAPGLGQRVGGDGERVVAGATLEPQGGLAATDDEGCRAGTALGQQRRAGAVREVPTGGRDGREEVRRVQAAERRVSPGSVDLAHEDGVVAVPGVEGGDGGGVVDGEQVVATARHHREASVERAVVV
jgi:hypothetical protein